MPYIIRKFKDGYKVCKKSEPTKCFSKKPLTLETAIKQKKAIEISENLQGGKKSNYVIAIPTYKRADKLKLKTLKLLNDYNIKNDIFIFVHTKEEYDAYLKETPKELYTDIIITNTKGIKESRNFIAKYFKTDTNVVCIDDDINQFVAKGTKKLQKLKDLDGFFTEAFDKCIEEKTKLWGIYPVPNNMFMKNTISIGLKFIIGVCYGFISTPEDKSLLTSLVEQKEDYERTIKYFNKFGKVIRFNYVSIRTINYAPGGLESFLKDRKKNMEVSAKILFKNYPEYISNIFYRKDGTAEIKLKNITNMEGAGQKIDIDISKSDSYDVYYHKIKDTEKYRKLSEELYDKLEMTSIPKIEQKRKDLKKTRGDLLGYNAWTFTFGCGNRRNLGTGEFSANKKHPELFKLLVEFGNEVVPKGYKYNLITVNKDMKAKKHKDGSNTGFSVITGLGDYEDGGLYVFDKDGNKHLYDLKKHILIFNGSLLEHMTEKFKGRRYTIIFYSHKKPCKVKNVKMEGSGKKELEKLLNKNDIDIDEYLKIAKKTAKKKGYDPTLLKLSDKKNKKLNYNGVNFGSSTNNDFIIYTMMSKNGEITKEEAKDHRRRYLARAKKIKGDWKKDKESPNSLAINILW